MSATLTPVTQPALGSILDLVAGLQAASSLDTWLNTGAEVIVLNNGSGGTETVSVAFGNLVDGQTVPPQTFAIAAGKTAIIGPFPPRYTNSTTKLCSMTYSSHTSLTLMAIRVPKVN